MNHQEDDPTVDQKNEQGNGGKRQIRETEQRMSLSRTATTLPSPSSVYSHFCSATLFRNRQLLSTVRRHELHMRTMTGVFSLVVKTRFWPCCLHQHVPERQNLVAFISSSYASSVSCHVVRSGFPRGQRPDHLFSLTSTCRPRRETFIKSCQRLVRFYFKSLCLLTQRSCLKAKRLRPGVAIA